jgi:exonuclease III
MDNSNNKSASSLKIRSYNANSVGKNPKRQQVFKFLKEKRHDITIIVDTRFDKSKENLIKNEWGGDAIFSSKDSQSRGAAIFFRKGLPVKIIEKFADQNGNMVATKVEVYEKTILLTGLYGPNNDDPNFYDQECFTLMDEVQADFSIYCGDRTLGLDQDRDTYNYLHSHKPDARNSVLSFMERESMCDIWRELNPEAKTFSWRKKNPIKFARLDFFLISSHLVPYITNTFIEPGFQSDHSIIGIEIDFSRVKLGRGFFKFNNSLLQDVDYVKLVKETIKKVTNQYSVGEYTEELWATLTLPDIDNIPVELDSQLFFEVLLMEIRGATIQFSARKKRLKNAAKNDLLNKLERKENEHFNDPDNNQ